MLENNQSQQNNEEVKKDPKVIAIKKKGLVLMASLALLVAVIIAGTVAWYTRVSDVTALNMNVAKFDFSANYAYEDFTVDVDNFINVTPKKAAPGTRGIIPIKIMATSSDVDVTYSLGINFANMDDRFRERVRFYYFTREEVSPGIYKPKMHVLDPSSSVQISNYITGTIPRGTDPRVPEDKQFNYEFIYWEWIYDLSDDTDWFNYNGFWYNKHDTETRYDGDAERARGFRGNLNGAEIFEIAYPPETRLEKIDAFDEFDTNLGRHVYDKEFTPVYNGSAGTKQTADYQDGNITLYAYQKALRAKFYLSGGEAHPVKAAELESAGKVYNPMSGSVYVDEVIEGGKVTGYKIIENADRSK